MRNSKYSYLEQVMQEHKNKEERIKRLLDPPTRYKTLYHYDKRFSKEFISDLDEAMDIFLSDKRMVAASDSNTYFTDVVTKNGFFRVTSREILVIYAVADGHDRYSDSYRAEKTTLVDDYAGCIYVKAFNRYRRPDYFNYDYCIKIWTKLAKIVFKKITDSNYFEVIDAEYKTIGEDDVYFKKCPLFSEGTLKLLRKVLGESAYIPQYSKPKDINNFEIVPDDKSANYVKDGKKVQMRAGKGVRKVLKTFGVEFTDDDVKNIVNLLSVSNSDYVLRVVEGRDITKYYNGNAYEDNPLMNLGSLRTSCMKHDFCKYYFQPYEEHAKMLILVHPETDKIVGRALLWDDVTVESVHIADSGDEEYEYYEENTSIKYMDRIYSSEANYLLFKEWAKENGYFHRYYQSYDSARYVVSPRTGEMMKIDMSLPFSFVDYSEVPFCDTFFSCDESESYNYEGGHYTLQETDGVLRGRDDEDDYDDDY